MNPPLDVYDRIWIDRPNPERAEYWWMRGRRRGEIRLVRIEDGLEERDGCQSIVYEVLSTGEQYKYAEGTAEWCQLTDEELEKYT